MPSMEKSYPQAKVISGDLWKTIVKRGKLCYTIIYHKAQRTPQADQTMSVWYTLGKKLRGRISMPKRTYQPKKRHRAHEHGFMKRMASHAGRLVLNRRRNKGRARLTH